MQYMYILGRVITRTRFNQGATRMCLFFNMNGYDEISDKPQFEPLTAQECLDSFVFPESGYLSLYYGKPAFDPSAEHIQIAFDVELSTPAIAVPARNMTVTNAENIKSIKGYWLGNEYKELKLTPQELIPNHRSCCTIS